VAGWLLTAERVQGRRIGRVRLTRVGIDEEPGDVGGAAVEATLRRLAAARGTGDSGDEARVGGNGESGRGR
jgi:hypothetical protein